MAERLDKKSRRKAWILLALVILAMLIPLHRGYKDGGTVSYDAVLYSVTQRHEIAVQEHRRGYYIGTEVRILFWQVYDDVEFVPDDIETQLSPAS